MTNPDGPPADVSSAPDETDPPVPGSPGPGAREPRPLIERVGLAIIALIVMAVFGAIAAASFAAGELFIALMGAIGVLMTAWAAGVTLLRG